MLFEVVRRAADTSPDVADLWASTQLDRRAGARMVVDQLQSLGPLPPGLGFDRAVDVLWLYNDPAHYDDLVLQCQWLKSDFTRWLAQRVQNALLGS